MKAYLSRWLLATVIVGLSAQALLAQEYPSKPVTMIIPFPPGGGNDTVGRYVADELTKKWGKKVVTENRGGAGGAIGAGAVVRSVPDGHTIMFASSSYTINAVITAPLNFDPVNDLSLVVTTGATDLVVTVGKDVPANNIGEMIALGKQKQLMSPYVNPFANLILADATGMNLKGVPYKGVGDITPELLSGRADVYIGTATYAAPLRADKQLKVLASMGRERNKNLPDVPTMVEIGYPSAVMELWWGVFVPSKTPREIKEQIHRDVTEIMARPEAIEFLRKLDSRPFNVRLDDCQALVKDEIDQWKMLGAKYNIGLSPN